MSKTPWIIAAVAALAAACASEKAARAEAAAPAKPAISKSELAEATKPPPQNECGASGYQYLVGTKKSALPAKPAGATWRVACTECAVTMDYAPTRLNIFFDQKTDVIKEVRCG